VRERSDSGGELVVLAAVRGERAARRGERLRGALEDEVVLGRLLGRCAEVTLTAILDEFAQASRALTELLALEPARRDGWIEHRPWGREALVVAGRLLDETDEMELADRLDLARLAARVGVRTPIAPEDELLRLRLDDLLGRAGLLEVRALRRRGRLEEARERYVELAAMFAADPTVFYFWLTLLAEDALTRGLLERDAAELTRAGVAFHRAAKLFLLAGSEADDCELLAAQARLDLLKGKPDRAVARLGEAPALKSRNRRVALGFLRSLAALRSGVPALARQSLLGLLGELEAPGPSRELAAFHVLEAAARLGAGHPVTALERVAPAAAKLRARGSLLGSLRAALVEARALLALRRRSEARKALAAGVLEVFNDLPETPVVTAALAAVAEQASTAIDLGFLLRLDLWLILAEDSPGVGLPD
jgi:tetratricopeptide (TPR) repeat protein